jgi:putative tricarboxylic transport membrane protein
VLPLILGVILGPRLEGQLRKSLQLSAGDPAGLWSEPIAVGTYILIALILLWPLLFKLYRRNRPTPLLAANATRGNEPTDVASGRRADGHHGGDGDGGGGDGGDGS